MRLVVVAIVLISAGVAVLIAIKLMREPVTWDMNPTRVIVPLDRPAKYAVDGNVNRAILDLSYRRETLVGYFEAAGRDTSDLVALVDMDVPTTVMTAINVGTIESLNCYVLARQLDVDIKYCVAQVGYFFSDRFAYGIHELARAYLMEAEGKDPADVVESYLTAGRQLAGALASGYETHNKPERRVVAALAMEFARARAKRLLMITAGIAEDLTPGLDTNYWCSMPGDEDCPGSVSTYNAIQLYIDGQYRDANTTARSALDRTQPWTYRSPYEHPLLWILAASLRHQGEDATGDFAELIDAALIAWPDDARTALLAFVDSDGLFEAGDDPLATCTSPGCRYFLAQYFYGTDDVSAGDAMTAAGLDLCDGVRSIPCTALRAIQIDTVGSP